MAEADVHDRLDALAAHVVAHAVAGKHVFVSRRPAIGAGRDRHAVAAQRVDFTHLPVHLSALDIGVAEQQEIDDEAFDQIGRGLRGVGAREQIEQRMRGQFRPALVEAPGNGGGAFGDHAHAAMHDGVALEPLAGERDIIARRPARRADRVQREQGACARTFFFARRRAEQAGKKGHAGSLV